MEDVVLMTDHNPARLADDPPISIADVPSYGELRGAFRQGDLVVVHRLARLPDYCFFNGEPATDERLPLAVEYEPPESRVRSFFIQLIDNSWKSEEQLRTSVDLPVSEATLSSRFRWGWFCVVLGVFGFAGTVAGEWSGIPFLRYYVLPCVLLILVAMVLARQILYLASCCYLDHYYIWLTGAHPDFLARLPRWPYAPR